VNISEISVRRPVTVFMITLIVIVLGVVSLGRLPIDLLPDFEIPVAIVSTSYQGVGPEEIEKLITKPIEESIGTVENIDRISSISSEGSSMVMAVFNMGTDMDFASLEMREKVDMIKGFLPDDASEPMVMKIDPNAQAIIYISLSGNEDIVELQSIANDTIKPRLERIEGIAQVAVSGGRDRIIEVKLNPEKMNGYGITNDYVSNIIGAENLNLPGGRSHKGQQELITRTIGEFESIDDIRNMILPLPSGGTVYLRELGDVEFKYSELQGVARTDGKNSIIISLQKQAGTNTVKIAESANKEIEKLKQELSGVKIETILDTSDYIKQSIDEVYNNALTGALLAVLVLLLFLRNLRTTFIIGVSIPVSIITTFIMLYFSGISLNLMTLGGLALGVGMLVDNSIVVLENIYRFRLEGYSRANAAVKGTSEVSMAVVASTLTTIAVFLPIVFVEGITSEIFKELALTVTISLVSSLAVALTLVPMLSSVLLKVYRGKDSNPSRIRKIGAPIFSAFDKVFGSINAVYKRLLNWSLKHRKSTVIIAILVFVLSIISIITVGAEFLPKMDEGMFTINVSLPDGAELEETDSIVTAIEEKLQNIEEIDTVFSMIGSIGSNGGFSFGSSSNRGSIMAALKDKNSRQRSTDEITDEVRELIKDIPGAEKNVSAMQTFSMGSGSAPISISIKGDELDTLKKIGDDFVKIISGIEGAREVSSSLDEGVPEIQVKVDRENASQYGLTSAQIASSVRRMLSGNTATTYRYDGEEIDVVVKGDEIYSESISNLKQIPIQTPMGIIVPLGQVAEVSIERGPVQIVRDDLVRVVTVSSQVFGRDIGTFSRDIQRELDKYDMPPGYFYEFGGENEEMVNAFKDLALALVLAVILVFMILASQFESLLYPFVILLTVPLGISGGALGLFITGKALSVPAFIGIIMLVGIVVNNAIVMVDYINTRRKAGEERNEAIVNAGPIRLRPILMTTLTTVLGLVPLAIGIGEGAELQAPLAIVVIGGLMLSTLLTLVLVPVVYTLFDDLSKFLRFRVFKVKTPVKEQNVGDAI
jgi:HAE1 family hydrophobic/amphiphilic exporter-1